MLVPPLAAAQSTGATTRPLSPFSAALAHPVSIAAVPTVQLDSRSTYVLSAATTLSQLSDLVLDGRGATLQSDAALPVSGIDGSLLILDHCQRITLRNIHFDGNRQHRPGIFTSHPQTLYLISCRGVLIENCTFVNDACDGVYAWAGGGPTQMGQECRDVTVRGCTFDNPGRNGISLTCAAFCRIEDCTFRHIRSGLTTINAGVDIEPNANNLPGQTHDIEVVDCHAVDCRFGLVSYVNTAGVYNLRFARCTAALCDVGIGAEASGTEICQCLTVGCPISVGNADACRVWGNTVIGSDPACCIYMDNHAIANPQGHWVYGNKANVAGNTAAPNVVKANKP